MTESERQAKSLELLELFHEGREAEAKLEIEIDSQYRLLLKRKVRQGENAFTELVKLHEGLVVHIYNRYFQASAQYMEEHKEQGRAAFFQAALSYDPNQGRTFGSWAYGYVRKAMLQVEGAYAFPYRLADSAIVAFRKIRAIRSADPDASIADVAQALSMDEEQVEAFWEYPGNLSLDGLSTTDDGEVEAFGQGRLSTEGEIGSSGENLTDTEARAHAYLDLLGQEEKVIVISIAVRGASFSEVGEALGVSKQAVEQRYKRIMAKLQEAAPSYA